MNELTIISEQLVLGKEFKVYGTKDEPLFLAKDVANWIENSNVTMMLKSIDEEEVTKQSLGGLQGMCNFITEDGLYEVLMLSRKPIAKQFKKEVKKILKQIRLTGGTVVEDREEEFVEKDMLSVKKYSFEQWCLDNNHEDYLLLWDYKLNICNLSEVTHGSDKECYFLCKNMIHESETFKINRLTRADKNKRVKVKCNKCNSIGFYLERKNLLQLWSESNICDKYKISKSSRTVIRLICEYCGKEQELTCNNFVGNGHLCCQCGDGVSYPNKFITNLLMQLNVDFIGEKTFEWSKRKRYDNYIENLSCIIENHGIQHYEKSNTGRSLKEEQDNDIFKKQLAIENGIKNYIELDCRHSKLESIKNSIMCSELPNLLKFKEEDINWLECEKYATKNLIKHICELWNTGKFETTTELSKYCNLVRSTVLKYLKIGRKFEWCKYDGKEEFDKKIKKIMKKVSMYDKDGNFIGRFESTMDLERKSLDLFGVKLLNGSISDVCNNRRKMYKGFIFKYE